MRIDINGPVRRFHSASYLIASALAYLLVWILAAHQFPKHGAEGKLRTVLARASLIFGFIIYGYCVPDPPDVSTAGAAHRDYEAVNSAKAFLMIGNQRARR